MKTVFDQATRDELISRISVLNENNTAQWGKMNLYQALRHCILWDEWVQGDTMPRQQFIGRLFGKMALKKVLKDEAPLDRNTPTLQSLKIQETSGDTEAEKQKWVGLISNYAHFTRPFFVHSFFGKMTREQIGQMAYKHADHHLRQFNG